ncbi:MAG: hypothetical protein DRJ40_02645 [Thermoprotei archaeon]|nr:MAG: hypothetical protein DRJ40_02645 [Thermoprotei archaeon]
MSTEPKFVDREYELKTLEELSRRDLPTPLYIYGPEGCGKTRLLREFITNFNGIGIYIDTLERTNIEKVLTVNLAIPELREYIVSIAKEYLGNIGLILAQKLYTVLEKIATKYKLKGKNLVIAVDDVTQVLGIHEIERYMKWLYEAITKIKQEYRPESILILVTTSEGQSLQRIIRHTYTKVNLLWNLPKEAFTQLANQLQPPDRDTVEKTWELTGGNPRRLIEIAKWYRWNIDQWLEDLKENIRDVAKTAIKLNLVEELIKVIENPDNIDVVTTEKMERLYKILLERNLVIYTGIPLLQSWTTKQRHLTPNTKLGIGRYYSWQIPAYKYALKQLLQKQHH